MLSHKKYSHYEGISLNPFQEEIKLNLYLQYTSQFITFLILIVHVHVHVLIHMSLALMNLTR